VSQRNLLLSSCEDGSSRFYEDAVSCLPMNVFGDICFGLV